MKADAPWQAVDALPAVAAGGGQESAALKNTESIPK